MHCTYLLLSGIAVNGDFDLGDGIVLQQANTTHVDIDTAMSAAVGPDDIAVILAHIPVVTAQIKICAKSPKDLAVIGWNSMWDAILLGALFNTEVGFNLYSTDPANLITKTTRINASNRRFHGVNNTKAYSVEGLEMEWLGKYYRGAKLLMDHEKFNTAVHCLASYRWHGHPRVQLAILWAGIESLFGASSEIKFRISLYIAKYLHGNNSIECKKMFDEIKKMYDRRSAAVHGSNLKGDANIDVARSAEILQQIIRKSAMDKEMPNLEMLAP